jgi:hypothetical protein
VCPYVTQGHLGAFQAIRFVPARSPGSAKRGVRHVPPGSALIAGQTPRSSLLLPACSIPPSRGMVVDEADATAVGVGSEPQEILPDDRAWGFAYLSALPVIR